MTYGHKIQYNEYGDPISFDFSPETFCQIVDNFSRVFSQRRLGMDYKHVAGSPELEPGPEQNLAYYSGLAVILQGKVIKLWDHDPRRLPPDPEGLLQELQKKFPRHQSLEDVDGLWGYKCEVTPLGEEKLPNCEQLSPLFSKEDYDEFGTPIGYNLLNVSAVGIAFQNGTIINLSKPLPALTRAAFGWIRYLTPPRLKKKALAHFGKGSARNITMNETLPAELMAKLMKHGLADNPKPEEVEKAFAAYMAETEEGPSERKATAEAYAKHMSKMQHDEPDGDEKFSKMDDEDKDSDSKEDEEKRGAMSKVLEAQQTVYSQMAKENKSLHARLEKLEKEREAEEKRTSAIAFAKKAIAEGRWPAASESNLVELAKAGQGESAIAPFSKGMFTVMQKWTSGGSVKGASHAAYSTSEESNASRLGKFWARGVSFAEMAKKRAIEKNIPLKDAQRELSKEHPELY